MSISPIDAKRSAPSSSSLSFSQSPESHHGSPPESRGAHHRHQADGARRWAVGPAQIAGPEAASDPPGGSYGPVEVPGDSCESSQNVTGSGVPDVTEGSYGQHGGIYSHHQSSDQGMISSQSRSTQLNWKELASTSYQHSDHLAMGSNSMHYNATQSTARRNQVVSGNHLLNFYYDPISRPQTRMPPPPRRQQKSRPYNRDLFLQANYKFVVLDTGNYHIESMGPDKMLQWEDIICVRYSTPLSVQCPICLECPMCPQITSCGHIYCFPCILQYLLMGEEDHKGECWKKCPLCFTVISSKDLYTIYIDIVKQYNVGDHAYFTLLSRAKDSVIPSEKNQQGAESTSFSSDGLCDLFSKFILTSDVELSVREAKMDLNDWLTKAEVGQVDDLEKLPYVCAALEQLEQRMKHWTEYSAFSSSPPVRSNVSPGFSLRVPNVLNKIQPHILHSTARVGSSDSETSEHPAGTQYTGCKDKPYLPSEKIGGEGHSMASSSVSEVLKSPEKSLLSNDESKGPEKQSSGSSNAKERDSYIFYQSVDGQHLILHPLNMKCLLHHYKSYDLLPQRIDGPILQLETVTQSETMRRRYRFLSHFSLTTTFQLCEIDLSDVLPLDAFSPFIEEIKKREKQRNRLAKKDQQEKARAEAAVLHASLIPLDHKKSSLSNATFSLDDFEALGSSIVPSTSPPVAGDRKLFSDVTRLGFAAAHDSPSLRAEESTDNLSNRELVGQASSITGRSMAALSFANIISTTNAAGSPEVPKMDGLGKKGKKPTRVLMSTSGSRRY